MSAMYAAALTEVAFKITDGGSKISSNWFAVPLSSNAWCGENRLPTVRDLYPTLRLFFSALADIRFGVTSLSGATYSPDTPLHLAPALAVKVSSHEYDRVIRACQMFEDPSSDPMELQEQQLSQPPHHQHVAASNLHGGQLRHVHMQQRPRPHPDEDKCRTAWAKETTQPAAQSWEVSGMLGHPVQPHHQEIVSATPAARETRAELGGHRGASSGSPGSGMATYTRESPHVKAPIPVTKGLTIGPGAEFDSTNGAQLAGMLTCGNTEHRNVIDQLPRLQGSNQQQQAPHQQQQAPHHRQLAIHQQQQEPYEEQEQEQQQQEPHQQLAMHQQQQLGQYEEQQQQGPQQRQSATYQQLAAPHRQHLQASNQQQQATDQQQQQRPAHNQPHQQKSPEQEAAGQQAIQPGCTTLNPRKRHKRISFAEFEMQSTFMLGTPPTTSGGPLDQALVVASRDRFKDSAPHTGNPKSPTTHTANRDSPWQLTSPHSKPQHTDVCCGGPKTKVQGKTKLVVHTEGGPYRDQGHRTSHDRSGGNGTLKRHLSCSPKRLTFASSPSTPAAQGAASQLGCDQTLQRGARAHSPCSTPARHLQPCSTVPKAVNPLKFQFPQGDNCQTTSGLPQKRHRLKGNVQRSLDERTSNDSYPPTNKPCHRQYTSGTDLRDRENVTPSSHKTLRCHPPSPKTTDSARHTKYNRRNPSLDSSHRAAAHHHASPCSDIERPGGSQGSGSSGEAGGTQPCDPVDASPLRRYIGPSDVLELVPTAGSTNSNSRHMLKVDEAYQFIQQQASALHTHSVRIKPFCYFASSKQQVQAGRQSCSCWYTLASLAPEINTWFHMGQNRQFRQMVYSKKEAVVDLLLAKQLPASVFDERSISDLYQVSAKAALSLLRALQKMPFDFIKNPRGYIGSRVSIALELDTQARGAAPVPSGTSTPE